MFNYRVRVRVRIRKSEWGIRPSQRCSTILRNQNLRQRQHLMAHYVFDIYIDCATFSFPVLSLLSFLPNPRFCGNHEVTVFQFLLALTGLLILRLFRSIHFGACQTYLPPPSSGLVASLVLWAWITVNCTICLDDFWSWAMLSKWFVGAMHGGLILHHTLNNTALLPMRWDTKSLRQIVMYKRTFRVTF